MADEEKRTLSLGEVPIINPQTGQHMIADHYALRDRGMIDGWVDASQLSPLDWFEIIDTLLAKR